VFKAGLRASFWQGCVVEWRRQRAPNEKFSGLGARRLNSRNLGVLVPIIQAKYDAGHYANYTDSLGIRSGNDKLIIIDRGDLADIPLV
jgi:hypothetical protein